MATTRLTRYKEALLDGAYAGQAGTTTLDPTLGGQNGFSPKLGNITADGERFAEWVSSAKYIRQPLIAVLIQAPRGFDYMPTPEKWIETLRVIIEEDSKSITGLAGKLTVEKSSIQIGRAGEVLVQPLKTTRERSQPVHVVEERDGKPYQLFLDYWIRYLIGDPDTQKALIGTLETWENDILTPDYYGATVLYFEPDVTFSHVRDAWLCTNWWPGEGSDVVGSMDINAGGETLDVTLNTEPITMRNTSVRELANSMLQRMSSLNVDPDTLPLFVSTEAEDALDPSLQ